MTDSTGGIHSADVLGQNDGTMLSTEARLLLAVARPRLTGPEQARIHRFLSQHGKSLDWGFFVNQASRHGILPLVGRNLIRLRLTHGDEGRALVPYRWLYTYVYEGNRFRNLALVDEYTKVVRALNEAGVRHAIRKGPVLCDGLYHDLGARRIGDLDVLLRRETLPEFESVVEELGYQQGHQSQNGERVVPFSRRTQVAWRVNLPNVALPYVKIAYRDDVELFVLDPCFSLFQPRSGIHIDCGEMLERSRLATVFGEPTAVLDPLDQIIDSCVQLHVEAVTMLYIEIGKDLTLMKFLDVAELLRSASQETLRLLPDRVNKYGCAASVYYALHHTAMLHPEHVPDVLLSEVKPADVNFLQEYGTFEGERRSWPTGFMERLFDQNRSSILTDTSTVPGPRAVV